MAVAGFTETSFTHDGTTRTIYRRGSGPGVIVMHEILGITPPVSAGRARARSSLAADR